MKKLFVIILMVIPICLWAQLLSGYVEAGYVPVGMTWGDGIESDSITVDDILTYIEIDLILIPADWFFISGALKNWQYMKSAKRFGTLMIDYKIDLGFIFTFRSTDIQVGFRHFCGHPIAPGTAPVPRIIANRGYEEIYVRIEF